MSILSKYYIDLDRLNNVYTMYDRIGDLNLVSKITDSVEWKKMDKGQRVLIFNTLRRLNVLLPYDNMEQSASNSPSAFFYNNADKNDVITEKDFEDEDDDFEYDDYDEEDAT